MTHYHFTSVTRTAGFKNDDVVLEPLHRAAWQRGQYVAATVAGNSLLPFDYERVDGRDASVIRGDVLVGALGTRAATLEVVGDWRAVGDDLAMDALNMGGVLGHSTSRAPFASPVIPLQYLGHLRDPQGHPLSMDQFALPSSGVTYDIPTILVVGTSMSAGKTYAARRIIRSLTDLGQKVAAAKVTGTGRYRDILKMSDAGATDVFDFCDVGLPSSIVPEEYFRTAMEQLMSAIAATGPDIVVIEAGASPIEPYNVKTALEIFRPHTRFVVLAASEPFAAKGFTSAVDTVPDLITGPATGTQSAVDLTHALTGVQVLDLINPASRPALRTMLAAKLGLDRDFNK